MKWMAVGVLALCCVSIPGQTKALRVAAAADLRPAMPAFAGAYEKKTGVRLDVTFGSSSALANGIVHGAPFDVFLGADFLFAEKVIAAGLAEEKTPVAYAQGTLVLWSRKDSGLPPLTMELLATPGIRRVAIADEFQAPYGRAAFAALRWLKLEDKLRGKLVTAENVTEAARLVETGAAQVGFVSLSFAGSGHGKEVGMFARVPAVYPKIRQCGVVLKGARDVEEARRFMEWMTSPEVQRHLPEFGLEAVK